MQKLLSLIASHLFSFVFIVITLGGGFEKIFLWFMLARVWPMFSSKRFIVSGFTFRSLIYFEFFFFFCPFFAISWAAPSAYGGSHARGQIRAIATGLHQSHSNEGSEPRLRPTPQLTATPDP